MKLLQSRRFLTLLFDVIISLVLYFTAKYAAPSTIDDIKFVIGALQPVFLTVIAAFGAEDYATAKQPRIE